MPFSATVHRIDNGTLRVDVRGQVLAAAAAELGIFIMRVIATEQPDELLIDLRDATALDACGADLLFAGYVTAIDCGTTYHVLHARGQARRMLQAKGTLDVLADSNDLGALLLAVSTLPRPEPPT
ncbi:STAS domain-containing protein [Amycolatopsis sp. NPDC051372]|uniref:STAS domain-containing protein n=1 Tax=unclassified Amycolatopsis TaxID=2618356 RepID=UPI0034136EA9